jgi:hypothetical protein
MSHPGEKEPLLPLMVVNFRTFGSISESLKGRFRNVGHQDMLLALGQQVKNLSKPVNAFERGLRSRCLAGHAGGIQRESLHKARLTFATNALAPNCITRFRCLPGSKNREYHLYRPARPSTQT